MCQCMVNMFDYKIEAFQNNCKDNLECWTGQV